MNMKEEQAIFAGGCFWCTEAMFRELRGVLQVESGYTGGTIPNPTYEQVCEGTTGHAEAIRITFDPTQITFETLVELFFLSHDPTTPNRQGHDIGTQYRSAIFFASPEQQATAEHVRQQLTAQHTFASPIVTEISPLLTFYPAESYHQRYFEQHGDQPYCSVVISPKLSAFRAKFSDLLRTS
jgi:peptide-methionine (S)-S-oxide reductase